MANKNNIFGPVTLALQPCPFCGSSEVTLMWDPYNKRYFVRCPSCYNQTALYITEESAVKAWNRRV